MSGEAANTFDVVVIGSGPGGYVAAIRAAQLGLHVACVERESLGGICLNWGCIPTKALLRSAEIFELCQRASEFGIKAENIGFDFGAIVERSRGITKKISKGVAYLFKKNKVTHVQGQATLKGAGVVSVDTDSGARELRGEHIIVATGARARSLPGIEMDGTHVIGYREAMTLKERPTALAIVGAGAIGVEFASFYRSLGTEVTIIEFLPRLVPNEDADVSAELSKAYRKRGITCHTSHKLTGATVGGSGVDIEIEHVESGKKQQLSVDKLLIATGVVGNVEDLGLEDIGVGVEKGCVVVNQYLETDVKNVHAVGDVIGGYALAHVASAEGVYVAERISGKDAVPIPYDSIPACTYCHPEIASVGLTEDQAKEQGIEVRVGRFPFGPLGKTQAAGEYPGFAKFLWKADNNELVGAHLIGPAVTDLIAEPTLAKTTEVNASSLIHTIHAHPTFAEALKEATEDAYGMAIHI